MGKYAVCNTPLTAVAASEFSMCPAFLSLPLPHPSHRAPQRPFNAHPHACAATWIRIVDCSNALQSPDAIIRRYSLPPTASFHVFAAARHTCARAFALIDTWLQRHGLFTRRECREASHAARQYSGGHLHAVAPRKLSLSLCSLLTRVTSNAFWRLLVVMVILIHVGKVTRS